MTTPTKPSFTVLPWSDFSNILHFNTFEALYARVPLNFFEMGLNPFDVTLLSSIKELNVLYGRAKTHLHPAFNVFSFFIAELLRPYAAPSYSQSLEPRIINHFCRLLDAGIFEKKHVLYTIERAQGVAQLSSLAVNLTHRMIEKGVLSLQDTVRLNQSFLSQKDVSVPIMFAIANNHHALSFFERYSIDRIKELHFDLNQYSPTTPPSTTPSNPSKRYHYLDYVQLGKNKKALAVCDQYLSLDKTSQDQQAVDNILFYGNVPSLNFTKIKTEIEKRNTCLIDHLSDPRLSKTLGMSVNGKDLLIHAIEANHMPLVERMMGLDVFKDKKNARTGGRNYVAHAAHKNHTNIEKILIDHGFYDITSFGSYHIDPSHTLRLSPVQLQEQQLYDSNTPKLSDSSWAALIEKGLNANVRDLFMNAHAKAYAIYAKMHGETMADDDVLMNSLKSVAENWMLSASWAFYGGQFPYDVSQKHIPIVLESIGVFEISIHEKHRQKAQHIEEAFLNSLCTITQAAKASLAINQYLERFPDKKTKLVAHLTGVNQDWARKFDQKNIRFDLQAFLNTVDKPRLKTSDKKKYKI